MQDWGVALGFLVGTVIVFVLLAAPVLYFTRRTRTVRDIVAAERESARVDAEYERAGMLKRSFLHGGSAVGTHGGVVFTAKVVVQGKVARSVLTTSTLVRGEFAVRREAASDGFFKSIGFAQEAQSGDEEFDRDFYLLGRSRTYLEALFAEVRNRAAVRTLMALGFDYLEFRNGTLEATRGQYGALPALSKARAAIEALASLREPPAAAAQELALVAFGLAFCVLAGLALRIFFAHGG